MNRHWIDNVIESNVRDNRITEIRIQNAPLDSTVALLADMEKAALDKILKSTRLENSVIDCVIHELKDPLFLRRKFLVRLKINGKILEIEHSTNNLDDEEFVKGEIIKKVAESIAINVLSRAIQKHY